MRRLALPLFSLTLFVNAALLFSVQPMFSKMVLPLLGGTPAIWNTCMLFFQGILLVGYLYSHVSSRKLEVRRQSVVQLALLALSLLTLPIALASGWQPPGNEAPVPWLIALLTVSLGAPFFVLSTGAPMLQRWFAFSGDAAARNPYFLYAASNLGSMVALLSYPLLIEPRLRLAEQSRLWMYGYWLLLVLIAACAWVIRSAATPTTTAAPVVTGEVDGIVPDAAAPTVTAREQAPVTTARRVRWVLLSFVPSSLLLALTTFITTDVASVPLLWILPLTLYLLTFVLVFARRQIIPHAVSLWGQALFVLSLTLVTSLGMQRRVNVLAPIHFAAFFFTAMMCHGELARDRPRVSHLTEFYLWISVGGVLGGVFNVLIAPVLFNSVVEYPIALVLACAIRPPIGARGTQRGLAPWLLDVLLPVALGVAVAMSLTSPALPVQRLGKHAPIIVYSLFGVICLGFIARPLRFAAGVAAVLIGSAIGFGQDSNVKFAARSFFGVYRVLDYPNYNALQHGTTTHGGQSTIDSLRREPLTYYHRDGPLGGIFSHLMLGTPMRRVGIVGLGTGTIACYGRPGENWTFFEIDPLVQRIASDGRWFTYLRDCAPNKRIVLGDARQSLAREPDGAYDLIILDAFSSDAIPVHLMTREALTLYLRKLAPGGSVAFHISNRYLNLEPVLAELARDARVAGIVGTDGDLTDAQTAMHKSASKWVVMSRHATDHAALAAQSEWRPLPPKADLRLWTDDYSDILHIFRWR